MNVKPGDLAICVAAPDDAYIKVGSIVEVVQYLGDRVAVGKNGKRIPRENVWLVKYNGSTLNLETGNYFGVSDAHLRPINSQEGDDETLNWLPVPNDVVHNAATN